MKRYSFLVPVFLFCFFTSCLKDKNIEDLKYGMKGVGDKPAAGFPYTNDEISIALNASAADTSLAVVRVRLHEEKPAASDVEVSLALNNALVTAAGFDVVPPATYSLDNLKVTIPAGSREGVMTLTIRTATLASSVHALGFTITSISDPRYAIADNFKNLVVALPVRNKYDGEYTSNGYFYHPSAGSSRAINNRSKRITTDDPNSVLVEVADLAGNGYQALITVDETTNLLDIQVASGAAGGPYTMFTPGLPGTNPGYTAAWTGSAASTNRYDPATRTFYMRYGYMGANGWRVTEEHIRRN